MLCGYEIRFRDPRNKRCRERCRLLSRLFRLEAKLFLKIIRNSLLYRRFGRKTLVNLFGSFNLVGLQTNQKAL